MEKQDDDQFFLDAMKQLQWDDSPPPPQSSMPSFPFDFDTREHIWINAHDLIHHPPSLSKRALRALKNQKPKSSLDLHGLTIDKATTALLKHTQHCYQHQFRHTQIICGKGLHNTNRPVLKNLCYQFLQQCPSVEAFTTASLDSGGTGCFHVRFRYDR